MIYFLSDAHLGSRVIADAADHQQKLVSLLQQMSEDASQIYLLGDMLDFYYEYLWCPTHSMRPFKLFFDTLRSLTDKGIQIHYFTGNHDIWTFGAMERETGVIVHREPFTTTLFNKTIYMAHGDEENASTNRSFRTLRAIFHNPVCQFLYRLLPPFIGDAIGYNWAKHSRQKELDNPIPYKGENNEELVTFAKQREAENRHADYYIFGHRHIDLDLMISRTSRVIIIGDTFKLWTYAALSENGQISLEYISE